MLTADELRTKARNKAKYLRKRDQQIETIAALCEQVAELVDPRYRPPAQLTGNPVVTIKPAPRILKASEITEEGWYAYRKPHGKWNVNMLSGLSYFTADKSTLANGWDDYELYGPIQLPE